MEKRGRKSLYTPELGQRICSIISTSNKGLNRLCAENEDFPTHQTITDWLLKGTFPEFSASYARAREAQADFLAAEIIEIADKEHFSTTKTETITENGTSDTTTCFDNHQRSRLMVDARKWAASKLAPKKYGEKVDVTSGGDKIKTGPTDITVNFKDFSDKEYKPEVPGE